MPEKSTYFFPKLASGLVFNSMRNDPRPGTAGARFDIDFVMLSG